MDHVPIIEANGSVSITGLGISYAQLLQMMAPNAYKLHSYQLTSVSRNQLVSPLVYETRDANGNDVQKTINSQIALNQTQTSIVKKVDDMNIIFSGNNSLNLTIQPNENVQLVLDVTEMRRDEVLDGVSKKLSEEI